LAEPPIASSSVAVYDCNTTCVNNDDCTDPCTTSTSTSTTSTTTTATPCTCYSITNEGIDANDVTYTNCGGVFTTESVASGVTIYRCTRNTPIPSAGLFTIVQCNPIVNCTTDGECQDCGQLT
jgi:hypothetical protein